MSTATTGNMKFKIGTYAWGKYYSFAKPVIPSSAIKPTMADDQAKKMIISALGLCLTFISIIY